jgi:copper(I)-binding protein
MIKKSLFIVFALTISLTQLAQASDISVGDLNISNPWVRASAPGQSNGAGYVEIANKSAQPDRLLSVQSPSAKKVELHTVLTENGISKMREVKEIAVPAQDRLKLGPGGFHIMFIQLNAPFMHGVSIPVTLNFEKAGNVNVDFVVQPATYNPNGSSNSTHNHGSTMNR